MDLLATHQHRTDTCTKCTICMEVCPVASVSGRFPGPMIAGPQTQRLRADTRPILDPVVDYCTNCKQCEVACPSGVRIASLIALARAAYVKQHGARLRDRLLGHADLMGQLATPIAPLANLGLRLGPVRWLLEKTMKLDRRRPFPPYARTTFRRWFAKRAVVPREKQVAYFVGCAADQIEVSVARAVVTVLERNGFQVLVPAQACCGLPLLANGDLEGARRYARRNLSLLREVVERGLPIVTSSTSCALTLRDEYQSTLGLSEARSLAARVFDICEFLLLLREQGGFATDFQAMPGRLPYHQPCHQRALGIGNPAVELLRQIPELQVYTMDSGCCGNPGTYGFKSEKYALTMRMGARLVSALSASQSDLALSDCETCRWQITYRTGVQALHPIQVLARAYRQ